MVDKYSARLLYPSGIDLYGYREPSGIYFSEYEPGRFLGEDYWASVYLGRISVPVSNSAYRQIYYNLNDYANKILDRNFYSPPHTFLDSGSYLYFTTGNYFNSLRLNDWLREKEQIAWLYYDQGFSGNYTRKLYTSSSHPFDDIGSGGENINSTGIFGFTYGEGYGNGSFSHGEVTRYRFLSQETSRLMPHYQIVKILKTIISGISHQCDNPVYNSGYPGLNVYHNSNVLGGTDWSAAGFLNEENNVCVMNVSGIPTPALPPHILTQLNNMSLRPTGFYPHGNWTVRKILPGSGFLPWLDVAQQIKMPQSYMTNHNLIYRMPILENSISETGHDTFIRSPAYSFARAYTNFPTSDFLSSRIAFAFMESGIYSIEFSGRGPLSTTIISGLSVDRFGNKAYTSQYSIRPIFNQAFYSFARNAAGDMFWQKTFYATGYTFNFTGYPSAFNRFYDPAQPNLIGGITYQGFPVAWGRLPSGYSEDNQYPFVGTTDLGGNEYYNRSHYYLMTNSSWELNFVSGLVNTHQLINIPNNVLVLNSGDFLLKINDLEIPTTEYRNTETVRLDTLRNYKDVNFGGPMGSGYLLGDPYIGSGIVSPSVGGIRSTYWQVTAWSGIIDVTHDVFKALTPHYIADTGIHYFTSTIVSGTFPIPQNYGFTTGNTLDLSTFTALPTGWSRINTRHRFNVSSTSLNFHSLQQMYPVIKHINAGFSAGDVMGRICQINSINAYANVLATGYWLESGISTTTFTNFPVSITTGTYGVPGFFTGYGGPYSGLISPSKCGKAASSWWN